MTHLEEALLLTLPPKFESVHPAIVRVLAWCTLQGVPAATRARIELPLVETLNNAIEHGCASTPDVTVKLIVRVADEEVFAEVTDPGRFIPPANWTDLPEDPFAQGGRGGYLISTNTDSWEHTNSPAGHALIHRWKTRPAAGYGLAAAAESENSLERLTADLANSFETLLGLTHFAGLLATSATFAQLLEKVHERLRTMVAHDHLIIRFIEDDSLVLYPVGAPAELASKLPLNRLTAEGCGVLDRRPLVGVRSALPPGDPLGAFADKICLMVVDFGGQTLGTLTVTRSSTGAPFSGGEVELLQAVADFIGIARATDNLWQERKHSLALEQEIKVAASIQRSLLPATFPSDTRWWIHGACRPAREVGGDYFDVVTRTDGGILLLIADVMGKGVPASLLAAILRSSLRAMADLESAPDLILTGINRQLFPDLERLGMFITAVLVSLPAEKSRTPLFANAGHCAPAIIKPDGTVQEAPGGDVPLGVLPNSIYTANPCPLALGDRLLLYTDGCYELNGTDGTMLGSDRYLRLASSRRSLNPPEFIAALLDPIELDLNPADIADDRTLVVATLRS